MKLFAVLVSVLTMMPFAEPVRAGDAGISSGPIVITGVTVIPMDQERSLDTQTVVIESGMIAAIGPDGSLMPPDGAHTIDGTGKFLMPGLADMHVHLISEGVLPLFVANGVTTVRNMAGEPVHMQWRDEVAASARTGPTILTTGPTVDGSPPAARDDPPPAIVTTPEEASEAVRAHAAAGYDYIKAYSMLDPEPYRALMATAGEVGIAVVGHLPRNVTPSDVFSFGQKSIEHTEEFIYTYLRRDLDEARIPEIVNMVKESGAWVVPTISTYANFTRLIGHPHYLEEALNRDEMRYLAEGYHQYWRHQNGFVGRPDLVEHHQRLAYQYRLIAALAKAGVPLMAGTDTPIPVMIPGFSLIEELRELRAAGLSTFDVLKAATAEPGRFVAETLPAATRFGEVREGYRADLVLLDADPLADIENVRRISAVIARGRLFRASDIQSILEAMANE